MPRDEREQVPHVVDLEREGLAVVVAWREKKVGKKSTQVPDAYRMTPEGQRLVYDAMARNAARALADPEQMPHRLVNYKRETEG